MKIHRRFFSLLSLGITVCALGVQGDALAESSQSPTMILYRSGKDDLRTIGFNQKNKVIFFAAGSSLFSCATGSRSVRELSLRAGTINDLYISDFSPNTIYVAAEKGAFMSEDFGASFNKIFASSAREDETYNQSRSIIVAGTKVFIGTDDGIYASAVGNWTWRKLAGIPRSARISDIIADTGSKRVIVASDRGVYAGSDDGEYFQRVGISRAAAEDDQNNEEEPEQSRVTPRCLFHDDREAMTYVGTTKGVYMIPGTTFSAVKKPLGFIDALSINDIRGMPSRPGSFIVATDKGAYTVDFATGQSVLFGASDTEPVYAVAAAVDASSVFMAARKNLIETRLTFVKDEQDHLNIRTAVSGHDADQGDPSIDEVRQAALYYNEVGPEKIKQWRKFAQLRALVPSVSLDYDKTIDVYQTATTQRVIEGPCDWGVSFSWDMGDLIWNPYQKDIDTRSRLNTQLRMEIIEEVTRLYFERKRLIRELQAFQTGTEEFAKRRLRLDEVTALLDGYTGNLYMKRAKRSS